MKHSSLFQAIGNTPLVKIPFDTPATVYAKLEYLNPGGSVKDRSALFMIEEAEKEGILKPGGTIIDASSGNHGIAVAMIGKAKGYQVIITVSEKISKEKLQTIQAYGAKVIVCPATSFIEDPRSYHSQAKKLHEATPNSFMPDQYFNTMNARAHESWLGPEIWQQTEGMVTHFVAGAGTGGTISGVGAFLKKQDPCTQIIAVDSTNSFRSTQGNPRPYIVEGMGIDFVTPVLNETVIDSIVSISDTQAIAMMQQLAQKYGLLVGPSSGAVAHAAYEKAKQLSSQDTMVIIFGDSGRAYLSKGFFAAAPTQLQQPGYKKPDESELG